MRTEGSSGGGGICRLEIVSATARRLRRRWEGAKRPGPLPAPPTWRGVHPARERPGRCPPFEDGAWG